MTALRCSATLVSLLVVGCSDPASPSGDPEGDGRVSESLPWFGRTRGSAVVMSRDERIAVVCNRSAGVVTVFELDPDAPLDQLVTARTELDFGEASEPWAAVIAPDGETAYVISRRDQTVTRIESLREEPAVEGSKAVGSEPTAIVITPIGNRLFVANWGEGTISVVDLRPDGSLHPDDNDEIDLNEVLVRTGVLGSIESRRGLAHPRALALTDDGDEDLSDETLYATEFFSMPLLDAGSPDDPGYFDRNRQGFVYPIALAEDGRVGDPIAIAPVADTGLVDASGAITGCFPNQLYAAAAHGDRLFVTSMCASPAGPLGLPPPPSPPPSAPSPPNLANFKTVMHPAVFAIDTRTNLELPAERLILSYELDRLSEADASSGTAPKPRMPLIPNDLQVAAPDTGAAQGACLTAMGADAVFCLRSGSDGGLGTIGERGRRYIDLAPRSGQQTGRLPLGLALSNRRPYALVINDRTQNLSVLDLEQSTAEPPVPTVTRTARAVEFRESAANKGRQHFATGLSVWSLNGEARVSCEGCHPDGLSDGVTWFFARGPRETPSTAGSYDAEGRRRVLLANANIDEIHDIEVIIRTVAGGVGAALWEYPQDSALSNDNRIVYDGSATPGKPTTTLRHGLNGSLAALFELPESSEEGCNAESISCDHSPVGRWDEIDAFIRSVRAPRRPVGLDARQVQRGGELFLQGRCQSCHGGPDFTLSRVFYIPSEGENGALPYAKPAEVTDAELGRLRRETYSVPPELRPLNLPGASGTATLRRWDPPPERDRLVHLYGKLDPDGYNSATTHGDDQINCVLRAVGTFPDQSAGPNDLGIVPEGSPIVVREVRQNMTALAMGATGFNIPSLVGLAASAPYFHAGNARTLEEIFDPAFSAHAQALVPDFLAGTVEREARIRELVAYLLSLDDEKVPVEPMPGDDLCPPSAVSTR